MEYSRLLYDRSSVFWWKLQYYAILYYMRICVKKQSSSFGSRGAQGSGNGAPFFKGTFQPLPLKTLFVGWTQKNKTVNWDLLIESLWYSVYGRCLNNTNPVHCPALQQGAGPRPPWTGPSVTSECTSLQRCSNHTLQRIHRQRWVKPAQYRLKRDSNKDSARKMLKNKAYLPVPGERKINTSSWLVVLLAVVIF